MIICHVWGFYCQNGTADAVSMSADDIYAAGLCHGLDLAAGESHNRVGESQVGALQHWRAPKMEHFLAPFIDLVSVSVLCAPQFKKYPHLCCPPVFPPKFYLQMASATMW